MSFKTLCTKKKKLKCPRAVHLRGKILPVKKMYGNRTKYFFELVNRFLSVDPSNRLQSIDQLYREKYSVGRSRTITIDRYGGKTRFIYVLRFIIYTLFYYIFYFEIHFNMFF